MCNNMCNDFGTFEEFCKEVNRLLNIEGVHGTYVDFWLNAYDENVLPNDALKVYLKKVGKLQ